VTRVVTAGGHTEAIGHESPVTPDFWRGRRVLITGHTGFKGSWLSVWLDMLGSQIFGYALDPPTQPSLYEQAGVAELVQSTIGDIRDLAAFAAVIEDARPEIVVHMAAQSLVLRSYEHTVETYSTNVLGTVHVLEALRRLDFPCVVVNVTTDKCYENKRWPWAYRENDQLGGRDPYSNSKACAELVAQAYRESFYRVDGPESPRVSIGNARAGNVIGGGDWTPGQLVPDTIAALEASEQVALRHPEAVRPWQHVLDCLRGYLTLAENLHVDGARFSGGWNFGPPDSDCRPAAEVVDMLARGWGVRDAWVPDNAHHAPEEAQLRLDPSKAAHVLGWRTALPLSLAVEWVADWYQHLSGGADAAELCRSQIREYTTLIAEAPSRRQTNAHSV
jgi:CDP-glucose 4,6-dehydratase